MQNPSKTIVPDEALREVVREHFDSPLQSIKELKEGYFNAAYQLELRDGLLCVMKIAPSEEVRTLTYEKNILKTEIDSMALARVQTDMPVPQVYCYDTSRRHIQSDYYIMEYLQGTPLHKLRESLSAAEKSTIDGEIGRLLRQLNSIQGTMFGCPGQERLRGSTWRETFAILLKTVLDDGEAIQADIPRPYGELYENASRHFGVLDEITTPYLVHWDMWDGNIFVDPKTMRITGMIDFERSLWGDPLMEVNFSGMQEDGPFIEGYGRHMINTPDGITRRHLYNLYLYLIMVIEAYYRDYVEAGITHWGRARLDDTLKALGL